MITSTLVNNPRPHLSCSLIGLSGFARVGKDEVANILVNDHGFTRIAFADKLRDVLYALNPIVGESDLSGQGYTDIRTLCVQDVIDEYGWNGYKESKYKDEIRRLLQRLGTEAGRETLWDSIWVDATLKNLDPSKKYVVSDARFLNEFQAIKDRGGEIWRIERPGVGALNDHASETEALRWPKFDVTIVNSSTLGALVDRVGENLW